ncbi:MAG: hypothetical protein E7564_11715 [Ruminococcaceae bacterium]|nr:hypothetical protein [Oscillospiraceae bacterium]
MATFTNRATLSYNGNSVNSNIVTGEIQEVLAVSKNAVQGVYTEDGVVTYVISFVNSGTLALENLTVTDNLGEYEFSGTNLYPLEYVDGSVLYYVNGTLTAAPTVTAGPPLTVSGVSVPAGGDAVIVYQARVTDFAPLANGSTITNEATVTGGGLVSPLTATETVTLQETLQLDITKALSPVVVQENGQLTYTFTIRNYGTTEAVATDNVTLTDTFDPILNPITVTFNGDVWATPANYTYNTATGEFATVPGAITVPAATVTQNEDGTWTVTPGVSTLTVTGTV